MDEKSGRIVPSVKLISGMDGDDVTFVLVVESYCVYHELVQANFHKTYSYLIMTGKGMPDVKLRLFVKYVMEKLEVPVFYLSDSDPNGVEITTVYKYGSANMAYDAENVANPHIVWLGIWSTDLPEYEIPYWELTGREVKKARQLLKKEYVQMDERLRTEVQHMIDTKQGTSIMLLTLERDNGLSEFVVLKLLKVMRAAILKGRV